MKSCKKKERNIFYTPNIMLEATEALKFTHSFKYSLGAINKIRDGHCSRGWDVVVNKPGEAGEVLTRVELTF